MIVFSGKISQECEQVINKYETRHMRIMMGTVIAICIIFITIIALTLSKLFFIMLPVPLPLIFLMFPRKDTYKRMPRRVEIGEDYISIECDIYSQIEDFSSIKEVVDRGDWYHIVFYLPALCPYFICQKDLITQGTLEEFEKLFEDKLVRQTDH